ncbi:unnamed protein product [Protopolystoma xenopodis]|uniref:Uncharacterized protein n=1 Tax=Protopolystoma xenopodis TaxID=117903 RepID=A0A3S5B212_9PLAT|nr:unnamed protein product [Protopolystoma xenopodis]
MSGRSARRRDDSLSSTGHLLPGFQTRRRSEAAAAAARPAGDSEVEHNQTPASNDLTLYGIVTLVCISVTLSLFMLILIVYLRRRQEKEPSGRLSAASAPTESEADAEAMTTNAKNEASLGFFLEHGRLGDALGGFTLPKRQMSPAGLMSRADTPQTRSATLISLATPNGLFFAQSRPEELMELKSKHAFYTCPFCQIFFISSESLRLARE